MVGLALWAVRTWFHLHGLCGRSLIIESKVQAKVLTGHPRVLFVGPIG